MGEGAVCGHGNMRFRLKLQSTVGIVLTAIGLVGILISFSIQKSDVDPTALTVAFAAISTSIVGLSLIIGDPNAPSTGKVPR
jgi:hypothetical protein